MVDLRTTPSTTDFGTQEVPIHNPIGDRYRIEYASDPKVLGSSSVAMVERYNGWAPACNPYRGTAPVRSIRVADKPPVMLCPA